MFDQNQSPYLKIGTIIYSESVKSGFLSRANILQIDMIGEFIFFNLFSFRAFDLIFYFDFSKKTRLN